MSATQTPANTEVPASTGSTDTSVGVEPDLEVCGSYNSLSNLHFLFKIILLEALIIWQNVKLLS